MHGEGKKPKHSILCGPIAPREGVSRGGYETANRRTITLLEDMGWNVTEFPYPDTLGKGLVQKYATYLNGFIGIWHKLGPQWKRTFHFTPLFKQFIIPEYLLLRRARRKGLHIILDLRAGNKATVRKRKGPLYRFLFDQCIQIADEISVEGQEYIPLVQHIDPSKTPVYLPNFVADDSVAKTPVARDNTVCRLIYVGTVSPEKGVPDLIKISTKLRNAGINVCVDIIGRPSESYLREFEEACAQNAHICFYGPQKFDFVQKRLDQSHFFVFLTKWAGEGHSNALTEAMARGCIPIVTNHGFNASTVAGCGVVIDDRNDHKGVADEIARIWHSGDLQNRGLAAISHVDTQFSAREVQRILNQLYCGSY